MKKMRILFVSLLAAIAIVTSNLTGVNAEWKNNSTGWWYSEENSYVTGWKQMDSVWYYFSSDGYIEKGWIIYKGDWYYLDSNGEIVTYIPSDIVLENKDYLY
jgi:glucan-binding YG repeat protein